MANFGPKAPGDAATNMEAALSALPEGLRLECLYFSGAFRNAEVQREAMPRMPALRDLRGPPPPGRSNGRRWLHVSVGGAGSSGRRGEQWAARGAMGGGSSRGVARGAGDGIGSKGRCGHRWMVRAAGGGDGSGDNVDEGVAGMPRISACSMGRGVCEDDEKTWETVALADSADCHAGGALCRAPTACTVALRRPSPPEGQAWPARVGTLELLRPHVGAPAGTLELAPYAPRAGS